jgi:hypothetical protein
VLNICPKITEIPNIGATGAITSEYTNLLRKEASPESEEYALAAGHTSAIKLKNAKAAPHNVVASAREQKDDDDNAAGDDADGSGAN